MYTNNIFPSLTSVNSLNHSWVGCDTRKWPLFSCISRDRQTYQVCMTILGRGVLPSWSGLGICCCHWNSLRRDCVGACICCEGRRARCYLLFSFSECYAHLGYLHKKEAFFFFSKILLVKCLKISFLELYVGDWLLCDDVKKQLIVHFLKMWQLVVPQAVTNKNQ